MIKNSINVNGTYHFFVNAVTKVLLFLKMETQNHRFVRNLKENLSITHVSKSIVKQRLPYTSFEVHGSRYGIVSPSSLLPFQICLNHGLRYNPTLLFPEL